MASGSSDVGICERPASGGPCVRPQVFDIDLYQDGRISGNDHTVNTAAGQVPRLESKLNFAINEQCFQARECTNNPLPG